MKINLVESLSISAELLEGYKEKLEAKGHEFNYYKENAKDLEELKERCKDADILMIANSKFPNEAYEANENLKLINVAFTGFDHVDIKNASSKGIKVCNASGYSNTAVSELIIGLVLNIYRKIAEGDKATREGKTQKSYYRGLEIAGKTVGIIGLGKIGLQTAKLFLAMGAKVIAYARTQRDEAKALGIEYMSAEDVMRNSDIVSINLALNEHTKGFVSKELLSLMKKDAILVNCARGPIVDNEFLAKQLNDGAIAYAAIDVFDMEPPIPADYPLLNCKNILLTPHIAFLTDESMVRRAEIAFDNTISFIEGEPKNIVN